MTAKQRKPRAPRKPRKRVRKPSRLMWVGYFAGIFVLFMIALAFAGRYAILQWGGKPFGVKGTIDVTIPKGYALMETSDLLENSGAIENARAFAVYTLLSGNRGKIQAGFYRIRLPIAPKKLIEELRRGSFQTKLTIPEGWTQSQIAQILRREGWIQDPKNWSDAIAPPVGAEYFGEEIASGAEGFCFPDTYLLERGTEAKGIRDRMLKHFGEVWKELDPARRDPRSEKLTVLEVVTLASIVERETKSPDELPKVASVFLNRLKRGMKLQSCATVHYALGEVWDRKLTYADLKIESPYNTYAHAGLPAGPIGNPGRGAIEAVLRPGQTEDLYFVHRGDGTHEFTRTYKEHQQAIKKFHNADPHAEFQEPEKE